MAWRNDADTQTRKFRHKHHASGIWRLGESCTLILACMDVEPLFDRKLAYLMLRFALGLSILMHGLVRLPHLSAFADGLVKLFEETPLPAAMVRPFAVSLVLVETIVGLLILLGLWTRWSLLLGALTMAALIFGTALRSDWNILAIQMLYASIYAALIATREYNTYSLDVLIQRK
jgi:thiosulfate dehydrogenase (quinone) large subunit